MEYRSVWGIYVRVRVRVFVRTDTTLLAICFTSVGIGLTNCPRPVLLGDPYYLGVVAGLEGLGVSSRWTAKQTKPQTETGGHGIRVMH